MPGDEITISSRVVDHLVKGIDIPDYFDLGETGREHVTDFFGRMERVKERAEFHWTDVAEKAYVLTEGDLAAAAVDGIRAYLTENKDEILRKLNEAAEAMKAELLAEPLADQV